MAKGPYATTLLSGGRLFTLGTTAIVSAWNASTGALVWRRDFSSRIDTSKLFCGSAMSPLMTAHGVVVHVGDDRGGTILALDPATGKDRWATEVRGPGYASPIELTVDGSAQVVTMTTGSVIGVDASAGKVLWEFPFDDEWNENIVTPVALTDGVIVSGVRQGTRRLKIARTGSTWAVTQAWHTPDIAMYMSSPVMAKGVDRAGFNEVRRYTVASSTTYAHPIVLRDRVIVRDASSLSLWTLR